MENGTWRLIKMRTKITNMELEKVTAIQKLLPANLDIGFESDGTEAYCVFDRDD